MASAQPYPQALVVTRVFNAPRALVFECFCKPEHITRWFGPRGFTLPVCEIDFRVGGRWRYRMRGPDGADTPFFGGVFKEIVAPERIVLTDAFEGPKQPEMTWTLTFAEQAGKTTLTMRVDYASEQHRELQIKMGFNEGLAQMLDRYVEHVASVA